MFNETTIGRIFIDEEGGFWEHAEYAAQPTATFRRLRDGETASGVVSDLSHFRPPTIEELQNHIKQLTLTVKALRSGR